MKTLTEHNKDVENQRLQGEIDHMLDGATPAGVLCDNCGEEMVKLKAGPGVSAHSFANHRVNCKSCGITADMRSGREVKCSAI